MTFTVDDTERYQLFRPAHDAGTPEEWEASWIALLHWKNRHQDDIGVEDAFEMLALLKSSVSKPTLVTVQ